MNENEKHWTQLQDHDLFPWLMHDERIRGWYILATVRSLAGGMELSAGGRVDYVLPVSDRDGESAVLIAAGPAGVFPSAHTGAWNEFRKIPPLDEQVLLTVTTRALSNAVFRERRSGAGWEVSVDDVWGLTISRELLVDHDA